MGDERRAVVFLAAVFARARLQCRTCRGLNE